MLVDEPCGSIASTFRVIARVGNVSQCVRDADLTYCREGGIPHSVRHFTVCTLAGDKNCKGRTHGI